MAEPAAKLDGDEERRMTAEEFLRRPDDADGTKYELVDGVLRAMSPATVHHGAIQALVAVRIGSHLLDANSPCIAVTEPAVEIRVRAKENRRIPDIGVTCSPYAQRTVDLPDPILLVEILSPGNRKETMENVRAYMTIPSVREILVVNSIGFGVQLLRRQEDGHWPSDFTTFDADGDLTLESIGLTMPAKSFYPPAPPSES